MKLLLPLLALALLAPSPSAQDADYTRFAKEFTKAMEYGDEPGMDKAIKSLPGKAVLYFQHTCFAEVRQEPGAKEKVVAMQASWGRAFGDPTVLEKLHRWCALQDTKSYKQYNKVRKGLDDCYALMTDAKKSGERPPLEAAVQDVMRVAKLMEEVGHSLDAAEAWALVSAIYNAMPERKLQDRRDGIYALERFVELREGWGYTQDVYYSQNDNFLKAERERIKAEEAAAKKREAEGYDPDVRGVEGLITPDAEDVVSELAFQMQKNLEPDLCVKGGPVPALWWEAVIRGEDAKDARIQWFTGAELHLMRLGATKFGVSIDPMDESKTQAVAAGTKPKATQFYLDTARKRPYAMWFYTASDREFVYQGELNLMPAPIQAPVFYKSAGSWVAQIKGETITFYDDTSDGVLFQTEPYKRGLKLYNLGQPTEGVAGPLFDSMRIGGGKAPRVPYSEFVKLGEEWFHLRGVDEGTKVGVRPLNPEYFKTGKVQLKWGGGKKTQPAFLAIKGRGQIATAMFDVGPGKEIEVPAGEYEICFGRVISGKGSRAQMASIFRGKAEPFQVEAGKLFTLEMGAPFALEFQRGGNDKEVEIEAPKITLHDRSGAVYADLFNAVLYPEVVASRSETGKGAKVIGEFIKMDDPEFVDAASRKEEWKNLGRGVIAFPRPKGSRRGDMTLKAKLPFKDAKVGLRIKRHPLFGKIGSEFK